MAEAQRVEPYLSSREKILQAARQLFAIQGFAETSVDAIAELAGVAKGTIYTHFSSKDELLLTIMRIGTNELIEQVHKLMKTDEPYPERLKNVTLTILEYFDRHHHFHRVYNAQRAMLPTPPIQTQEFQEEMFQHFRNFHAVLTVYIQEGINTGFIRPILAEEAAFYFPQLLGSSMFFNGLHQDKKSIPELAEAIFDIFINGFGTQTAS